jgi:hypothetical protein
MLLDGNGFLWHTGNDPYGHAGFATATTRNVLTKSTTLPNGTIANFWNVWSYDAYYYCATFIRTNGGATYVCGQASGYSNTQGTTGGTTNVLLGTGAASLPTTFGSSASTGLVNIKEVYLQNVYTGDNRRTIHWLRDDGKVFAQGTNGNGEIGNPHISFNAQNNNDESNSTNFPVQVFLPPASKVVQILPGGGGSTDLNWQHGMFYLLANGQIFASGEQRNAAAVGAVGTGQRWSSGNFMGFQPGIGESFSSGQPTIIHYAR